MKAIKIIMRIIIRIINKNKKVGREDWLFVLINNVTKEYCILITIIRIIRIIIIQNWLDKVMVVAIW